MTEGSMNDTSDGDTDKANGKSGDLGSVSSASGIKTLKTYLGVVAADADSTAKVLMDTVDFTTEGGTTTEYTYAGTADTASEYLRVLYITPNSAAAAVASTKQKRAFVLDGGKPTNFGLTVNSTEIFLNSGSPGKLLLDANADLSVANIMVAAHVARATAAGVTMTAAKKGNATADIIIYSTLDSALAETSAAVVTNTNVGSGTVITFTIGPNTVTTTIASQTGSANDIATRLKTAFETQTNSVEEVTLSAVTSGDSSWAKITATAKDKGTDGHGMAVSISVNK